jgi:hypothetical protein
VKCHHINVTLYDLVDQIGYIEEQIVQQLPFSVSGVCDKCNAEVTWLYTATRADRLADRGPLKVFQK